MFLLLNHALAIIAIIIVIIIIIIIIIIVIIIVCISLFMNNSYIDLLACLYIILYIYIYILYICIQALLLLCRLPSGFFYFSKIVLFNWISHILSRTCRILPENGPRAGPGPLLGRQMGPGRARAHSLRSQTIFQKIDF